MPSSATSPPPSGDAPVIAVDLGGTKALFGLHDASGRLLESRRFACVDFPDLPSMFSAFLGHGARAATAAAACIGVAAPVTGRRVRLTNLPWEVDADALQRSFGIARVELVNDFVAAAAGLDALEASETRVLQPGAPQAGGARLVVGAGTGFGAAILVPREGGQGWRVLAGEAGHAGFAPCDPLQSALLAHLRARVDDGHVPVEAVVSGPGIVRAYAFLRARRGLAELPAGCSPATVAAAGLDPASGDVEATQALDLFASALGAAAGDLALACLPRAGVCIAGGVAPKVMDARRQERFLSAFRAKGGHAGLMAGLPVRLVTAEDLGLRGAALLALGRGLVG